jgi:hypothetical protein
MTTKGITSPAPGSSNWDVPLNANFAAIEKAFGDATSIATTAGAVTLNTNQIGHMCLRCTGALTANLTLQVPSGTAGQWVVVNATTDATGGPWTVSITSLAGGTPIQIARGSARSVYADGTNNGVVFADTIIIPGSDNQIIYNDAGALTGSSTLTFDGAAVSVGGSTATTGASWSAGTATVNFNNGQIIPVGSVVSVTGVVPSGYNGSRVTTGTAALNQVQFAVATDPGVYASAGTLRYGNLNLGGSLIGGVASQELAEAGTNNTTIMTPLSTAQAIASELLLSSGTVSNAAQLDIILSAYTGYSSFEIRFFNLLPVSNTVALYMQVSTNGGSSFVTTQDYRSYGNILNSNSTSTAAVVDSTTAGALYIGRAIGNTTFKKALGSIIFSPRSDGFSYMSRLSNENAAATDGLQQFCSGSHTSTNVNAVRLLMSAGNISTMSWSLYGSR